MTLLFYWKRPWLVHSKTKSYSFHGILFLGAIAAFQRATRSPAGVTSTKNVSLVENKCVKIKCDDFSQYVSAIYLAPDVGKRAYELFVEDVEVITGNSELRDVILVVGDCQKSNANLTRRAAR
jgi:hypothetical protein